jgi:hypothetical protein
LKGLLRCAYCGEKVWANTTNSGSYYRDVSIRRGMNCSSPASHIKVEELDAQIDGIINRFIMPPSWQIEVLNIVTSLDERVRVAKQKERVEEKLKRLRKLYSELEISEAEYELEKKRLEITMASLIVPKEDETIKAGEKLRNMLTVWKAATEQERAQMLSILLESVYCDIRLKKIIALKPRAPFLPLFALCEGLKEKDGLIVLPEPIGITDPEGI